MWCEGESKAKLLPRKLKTKPTTPVTTLPSVINEGSRVTPILTHTVSRVMQR